VQLAMAEFMREGHYLRHLRRTKRAYSAQRNALLECLQLHVKAPSVTTAGLAALLRLPDSAPDILIAKKSPHVRNDTLAIVCVVFTASIRTIGASARYCHDATEALG